MVTTPEKEKPPRLTEGQRANVNTLMAAARAGDLALVSARRVDGTPVAILCAVQQNERRNDQPGPAGVSVRRESV